MRTIYIENSKIADIDVLYDGLKSDKHRKEFDNIADLLEYTTKRLPGFNPKKPIQAYIEGYNHEEENSIKKVLNATFSRIIYPKK